MVISSTTIEENAIIFIRNLLRANVSDPLSRSGGIGFVMTSYPDVNVKYPIITVKGRGDVTQYRAISAAFQGYKITLEIRVWARNEKERTQLIDAVRNNLRTKQYATDGTKSYELFDMRFNMIGDIDEKVGEANIKSTVMEVSYTVLAGD